MIDQLAFDMIYNDVLKTEHIIEVCISLSS